MACRSLNIDYRRYDNLTAASRLVNTRRRENDRRGESEDKRAATDR